ncbi:NAD(P)/FAD-dependent oxidoreductase [Rhodococcus ruber]|uniref:NAD(P)/FAD-dependent oxidoreductase n=1 Tax=Rhodococcus ruber TaxID=1830 RepID=A0ABT4MLN1_9NOCA|nr:NAD(P)/FAD-dependent oxidoreductase [Rhodococcus ruber]MCZ4521569.1 NAD(P)/FAD-dependent oxidoreductase [Rhodococcus ruber]
MPDSAPITMLTPDFPFPYSDYLANPAGIGSVPSDLYGTEVAVIGAGVAGLVAALELMKMGLKPVVYEASSIGGRLRGAQIPGAEGPVADLGAMRFPMSSRAFWHYADRLGIETCAFPNPLTDASPSTVVDIAGRQYEGRALEDLPPFFQEVFRAWVDCLEERADFSAMRQAIRDHDLHRVKEIWNELVPRFDDMSFSHYLATSRAFSELPFEYREAFGQIGFGSGGWDVSFPNSILEILRVVYMKCEDDHRRIIGGAETFTRGLWTSSDPSTVHWPTGTTLESLHDGSPLGEVRRLARVPQSPDSEAGAETVAITDANGTTRRYRAVIVTCHKGLLSTRIDTEEGLFDPGTWMAMRRVHYLQSSKTFIAVDRPFWLDVDPTTGKNVMGTTLTDRITRGTYLFDNGPDMQAMICLSYTWCDDSLKWLPLDADERASVALRTLADIYPDVDVAGHVLGRPITVSWEDEPHFMGAFKINLPGHYRYQRRLYAHFVRGGADDPGVFLAGDDVSWTAGWVEGAVTTGINAVWAVMNAFGGKTHPDNPGPGDRFDELAPILLP